MPYPLDDTIVAIASPPGGAALGIVRLSGPGVRGLVEGAFRAADGAELGRLRHPTSTAGALRVEGLHSLLPCEVYLWPDGRSYTGQPVAEIHTLGSWPLLEAVVRAFCAAGARLAEPGEFTLRAFLAGRIDLTQAEAVLGVIDAADPAQLQTALAQLAGGLAGPLGRLRGSLLDLLAHLEAGLDFADEDLPFLSAQELEGQLGAAREEVHRLARQMDARGQGTDGLRAVLVGWPNTGKSSLFNALIGKRGALVSEQPGTTRDYLTAELDCGGLRCLLVDTAGMDPASPRAESEVAGAAQAVAEEQSRRADVEIFCLDSTRPLNRWEQSRLEQESPRRLVVLTKIDAARHASTCRVRETHHPIETSSITGQGIAALREAIGEAARAAAGRDPGVVAGTATRCRESLRLAAACLDRAAELARSRGGEELVAAEIRLALEELGKTVGAVYTEDVLDRVFSRFCIGK